MHVLTKQEDRYQKWNNRNRNIRERNCITPASTRFIAEFRLNGPILATNDTLNDECPICKEKFQTSTGLAQWPCPKKHTFHFDCMLNTLRTGHMCPICRFPVEISNN